MTNPDHDAKKLIEEKDLVDVFLGKKQAVQPIMPKPPSYIKEIKSSINHVTFQASMILNLVNDLLDLAKIEAFKFKLNEDYFDLVKVVA